MAKMVVARLLDGRVVKGSSLDVDPSRPTFHIRPPGEKAVEVTLADLKALFFVRSLEGDPEHHEWQLPNPGDSRARGATVVSLKFPDGETMVGMTIQYPPKKAYFFLTPVDAKSNNIRILVNRSVVTEMKKVEVG